MNACTLNRPQNAILHDCGNSLMVISAGLKMLDRDPERGSDHLRRARQSTAKLLECIDELIAIQG